MPEILEAAHIKPYKYNGEDTVVNGFAMRTDIHILFDTGHLRISPEGNVVLTNRPRLDYGTIIPPRIVIPPFTNLDFVRWRWGIIVDINRILVLTTVRSAILLR